jgi:hypothetical protein
MNRPNASRRIIVNAIKAIVKDRRIALNVPDDWPEGTEVKILPVGLYHPDDDEEVMTDEEIAQTLAAMDLVEPFEMTDEEIAALAADRKAHKEWEKAHFDEHAEHLRRMWE